MDSTIKAAKRKRKKTRRCLDELRKRSRSLNTSDIFDEYKPGNHSKVNSKTSNNNSITIKRLTLKPSVFSRSVKSETITRPAIAHKDVLPPASLNAVSKQLRQRDFNEEQNNDASPSYVVPVSGGSSSNRTKGTDGFYFQVESDSDVGQYASKKCTSKSFILFSPISQVLRNNGREEEEAHDRMSGQSSRSVGGGVSRAHRLYGELVRELPARLQRRAPALQAPDIITKIKCHLQKLYAEVSSDNDVTKSCTPILVETRRGRSRVASVLQELPSSPVPVPSDSSSPAPLALITDTPEYTYYPRKLNQ